MKRSRKLKDKFVFWEFLIMLSIVLNIINFYFISGLYTNGENLKTPLSNTVIGSATGYFVFGNLSLVAFITIVATIAYFIFRKVI